MKVAARRAYGAQLPNGDQQMVPGPFDSLARTSQATCDLGGGGGGCWCPVRVHFPAWGLSCKLYQSLQDLATGSAGVGTGLQPGAALEEGRLPWSHAPSRASSRCPDGGCLGARSTPTPLSGQKKCSRLPAARGLRGRSPSTTVEGRRRWALCHIPVPIPGRCRPPPRLRGNGSQGSSMPNFTFQMGLLAPSQHSAPCCQIFWQTASRL